MKKIILSFTLILACFYSVGQDDKVMSGPVLGYTEMKEALIWIQLKEAGTVYLQYWAVESPDLILKSDPVSTSGNTGNTAKIYTRGLEPGRQYEYSVWVDGEKQDFDFPLNFSTEPLWEFRGDPPTFTMAMGSCIYINEVAYDRPGRPYGGEYEIFNAIHEKQPEAMLWLGDNIYLRPADWWTRTGYLERYTHTRSLPELQALMASCNNYAIWDDHDFGPNDVSGSWLNRDLALEAFKLFWPNPSFGYRDMPSTFSGFNYRDCDFIMMDNRFYRTQTSDTHPEQIFGKLQCDRMIDLLQQSQAPFKFIVTGGQFLNSAQVYENHSNYEEERNYILKRLNDENIKNVIFVSGDRHHSEVSQLQLPNGNMVYEFTVSPLTSGAASKLEEENEHRVDGSVILQRNFALMTVSGAFRNRSLLLKYYDASGVEIYTWSLEE